MVAIQESRRRPTRWKFTAFKVPLQRPTPTVAPVMHIEVLDCDVRVGDEIKAWEVLWTYETGREN